MTTESVRYVDFDASKRERDAAPVMLRFAGEEFPLRAGPLSVGAMEGLVLLGRARTNAELLDAMHMVTADLCLPIEATDTTPARDTDAELWAALRREQAEIDDLFKLADEMYAAVIGVPLGPSDTSPEPASTNGQQSKDDSSSDTDPDLPAAG